MRGDKEPEKKKEPETLRPPRPMIMAPMPPPPVTPPPVAPPTTQPTPSGDSAGNTADGDNSASTTKSTSDNEDKQ